MINGVNSQKLRKLGYVLAVLAPDSPGFFVNLVCFDFVHLFVHSRLLRMPKNAFKNVCQNL